MPERLPPPTDDGVVADAGWYADSEAPGLMRWWDGSAWSESDIRMAGEESSHPGWHPASLLERHGHRTRVGTLLNLVLGAFSLGRDR